MAIKRNNSPYSASLTGCTFMYYEMNRCLPLLMSNDADALIKQEIEENKLLLVNSLTSRKRFVAEFRRRYNAVPRPFWLWYQTLDEKEQRAALLYAILKTYRLAFDFHFNVTRQAYFSITHELTRSDLEMEFFEIASRDEFVNSWSDDTRKHCISSYMTILRHAGLLDSKTNTLSPILLNDNGYAYYLQNGEQWFLEACLLQQYEIDNIKKHLL